MIRRSIIFIYNHPSFRLSFKKLYVATKDSRNTTVDNANKNVGLGKLGHVE